MRMQKFISDAGTMYWWISVVVVGVVVNILAAVCYKYFGSIRDKYSKKRQAKKVLEDAKAEEKIKRLRDSDFEKIMQANLIISLRVSANTGLLLAIAMITLALCLMYLAEKPPITTFGTIAVQTGIIVCLIGGLFGLIRARNRLSKVKKQNEILWRSKKDEIENQFK